MIENSTNSISDQISLLETKGARVNANYYKSLNDNNKKTVSSLEQQKSDLVDILKTLQYGCDEWFKINNQIAEVDKNIQSATQNTIENINKMNELTQSISEAFHTEMENVRTEFDFITSLFDGENFDTTTQTIFSGKAIYGNATMTDKGAANLYSNFMKRETYNQDLKKYNADRKKQLEEDAKIKKELEKNSEYTFTDSLGNDTTFQSLKQYNEWVANLNKNIQDTIKSTHDTTNAIVDLVNEGLKAELEYINKLIDAKKEELSAEKSLHDYQNTISDKTKNISTLTSQIAALSGNTSEEGQARLQELQKQLDDAKNDLKETEYDKYISDQQAMLDSLYQNYSDLITVEMNDIKSILNRGLDILENNKSISETISSKMDENGYSDEYFSDFSTVVSDSVKNGIKEAIKSGGKSIGDLSKDKIDKETAKEKDVQAYGMSKQVSSDATSLKLNNNDSEQIKIDKKFDDTDNTLGYFNKCIMICKGSIADHRFIVKNTRCKKDYRVDVDALNVLYEDLKAYLEA